MTHGTHAQGHDPDDLRGPRRGRRSAAPSGARHVLGDDQDAALQLVRIKEVPAADFEKPAGALYDAVVAAIKAEEGLS
jgi:hypothetical protein